MGKIREFSCPLCGCKRFLMHRHLKLLVDFSREGAVEGHPFLEGPEQQSQPTYFSCAECQAVVPNEMSTEMQKEVL